MIEMVTTIRAGQVQVFSAMGVSAVMETETAPSNPVAKRAALPAARQRLHASGFTS